MDLHQQIIQLLQEIKPGQSQMTNTAYDTAWVARLFELGEPIAEDALSWLRHHQLADGSWGAEAPLYHHDRLICTLAAMIALARRGLEHDKVRIKHGLAALEIHWSQLADDPAGETIAFEMLFPTLMVEAQSLGLINRPYNFLDNMARIREVKLARSPKQMISRLVSMVFSAEMAGGDGVHLLDTENLQEANGSVGFSPSATAYFSLFVDNDNGQALEYLRGLPVYKGGVPNVFPIDVFEAAWTLQNLSLITSLDDEIIAQCQPHLDFLEGDWEPNNGMGYAAGCAIRDSDGTSVVYETLTHFGRQADLKTILSYEKDDHFRCFHLEANPSVSANIHVLGALNRAGLKLSHPSVQKVRQFLYRKQTRKGFWVDKWHASPYYPTAHTIIAGTEYDKDLVAKAVAWILNTQRDDGAWGYYYMPTAEETAYCLQALVIWQRCGGDVPLEVLRRGASWLQAHIELPYPPLWIGKCLYAPMKVIRSTILSALLLTS
ncbi:cyclase [Candidatus Leptofilum sp.]|uniref:cyclase n=1 Tax=Candidatus Leptofilum sp. TaxID=3241576 RepID=UPI003B5C91CC